MMMNTSLLVKRDRLLTCPPPWI